MRVDFVIGGTQKGGTSALDSFLRQHPEICMPETKKELHFFDREADDTDYKKNHANFQTKRGKEKLPLAEAIEKEPERCREALPLQHRVYSYVDRGFYALQVRRLFNI